jgi:hypothetical protein
MSAAEIADNKWELESAKAPIKDPGAIGQIGLMGGLSAFFLYVTIMSCVAIVSPAKEGTLADQYKDLNAEQKAAVEAEPAAAVE